LLRDAQLMIRMTDSMKFRFQRLADRRGVTMSALAAVVIGSWVDSEEVKERVTVEMIAGAQDLLRQKVDEPFSEEQFKNLERLAPSLISGFRELAETIGGVKTDQREP